MEDRLIKNPGVTPKGPAQGLWPWRSELGVNVVIQVPQKTKLALMGVREDFMPPCGEKQSKNHQYGYVCNFV